MLRLSSVFRCDFRVFFLLTWSIQVQIHQRFPTSMFCEVVYVQQNGSASLWAPGQFLAVRALSHQEDSSSLKIQEHLPEVPPTPLPLREASVLSAPVACRVHHFRSRCGAWLAMSVSSSVSLDRELLLARHLICVCWMSPVSPWDLLSTLLHSVLSRSLSYTVYSLLPHPLPSSCIWMTRLTRDGRKGDMGGQGLILVALVLPGCLKMDVSLLESLEGTFYKILSFWVRVTVLFPSPFRPRSDSSNSALTGLGDHPTPCGALYLPLWTNPPLIILIWVFLLFLLWLWPLHCVSTWLCVYFCAIYDSITENKTPTSWVFILNLAQCLTLICMDVYIYSSN